MMYGSLVQMWVCFPVPMPAFALKRLLHLFVSKCRAIKRWVSRMSHQIGETLPLTHVLEVSMKQTAPCTK